MSRSLPIAVVAALLSGCLLPIASTQAQTNGVSFDATTKVFRLDAAGLTYAFGINDASELQPVYWGKSLGQQEHLPPPRRNEGNASFDLPSSTTPQEYAGWGAGLYVEPTLKATFHDGNRDLVLHYLEYATAHSPKGEELTVTLKDVASPLFVDLHYRIDAATGIIGRWATIRNRTAASVVLEEAGSATWNLPRGTDYSLRYLTSSPPISSSKPPSSTPATPVTASARLLGFSIASS
jgi:alpha-galactosidase